MLFCFWCFEEYLIKEVVILIKKDLVLKVDCLFKFGINEF